MAAILKNLYYVIISSLNVLSLGLHSMTSGINIYSELMGYQEFEFLISANKFLI